MATVDHELGIAGYARARRSDGHSPERDVPRARDVATGELRARTHVEDHRRRPGLDAGEERLGADPVRRACQCRMRTALRMKAASVSCRNMKSATSARDIIGSGERARMSSPTR